MKAALARRDAEALREQAHSLRGGAATMGAVAVAGTARALEEAGGAARLEPVPALLAELEERTHRTRFACGR